jgi:PAS domain S-box-containing protein
MSGSHLQRAGQALSAGQALEFLADAGEVLSSSLDYGQTLRRVARLAVPVLADWCAVYIAGDAETEAEITSGHADPALEALLLDIRRRRREVDGASESRRVAETAEPILATDTRLASASEVDGDQRGLVERLAPRSYMIVPLLARGRTIGSLTLLSTRPGRHYGAEDLAFVQTLAARCALAIDNARLHDAAERSLSLLDTVFATAPVGLAFLDRDLRFVRVNEAMAAFNGRPAQAHLGRTLREVLGPGSGDRVGLYRRALETGRPVQDHHVGPEGAAAHEIRHFDVSCTPVHGPAGDLLGVSAVVLDVTERHRLLEAEREARTRADFLARAGALLDESLDYEETLRAVAEIAVPRVADWCAVSVLDDFGVLRQVAAEHVDPAQRRLAEELNRRFPADPAEGGGTVEVARTGETLVVPEITDEMLVAGIGDPQQLALVRRLGLCSIIIAALRAHGRLYGTLTLATTGAGRRFDAPDVQLAEELARRAATAIDNARMYTERTRIAHALQVKLLPARLPDIPHAHLAARYRAAGELNEVGGDFYDVFPRAPGQWVMVVGDVSGKGPEAAAVTALARYTLRAGAQEDDEPDKALLRLNGVMRTHDDTEQFATAALAHVAAAGPGRMHVRLALAGHPPPIVVRRDGTVEPVGAFGPILSVLPEPAFSRTDHLLGPGDLLLLYTDGVTEAGPRTRQFGDTGFADLLAGLGGRSARDVVTAIERAVVDAQDGRLRDDMAVLALALDP